MVGKHMRHVVVKAVGVGLLPLAVSEVVGYPHPGGILDNFS